MKVGICNINWDDCIYPTINLNNVHMNRSFISKDKNILINEDLTILKIVKFGYIKIPI